MKKTAVSHTKLVPSKGLGLGGTVNYMYTKYRLRRSWEIIGSGGLAYGKVLNYQSLFILNGEEDVMVKL